MTPVLADGTVGLSPARTTFVKQVEISAQDFQTLNGCLDDANAGAVTEFSRQREEAPGEGEAERLGSLTHELRTASRRRCSRSQR